MWYPDEPRDHEITIGDVGYLNEDGAFCRLFNTTVPHDHRLNAGGVPNGFESFGYGSVESIRNCLSPQAICSTGVTSVAVGGDIGSSHIGAKLAYSFSSTTTKGAILVLNKHARKEWIPLNIPLKEYIVKHAESWYTFATEEKRIPNLSRRSIIFVHGWLKTKDWAVAAFKSRIKVHDIEVCAGGICHAIPVDGGLSITLAQSQSSSVVHRTGPKRRTLSKILPKKRNQCVSILRCTVMGRSFWKRIRAGAGPHQLPDSDFDQKDESRVTVPIDGNVGSCDGRPEAEIDGDSDDRDTGMYLDLLDEVLDFIFETTDARVAIVSDKDVNILLKKSTSSSSILDYLKNNHTLVEISEDSVASLAIDDNEQLDSPIDEDSSSEESEDKHCTLQGDMAEPSRLSIAPPLKHRPHSTCHDGASHQRLTAPPLGIRAISCPSFPLLSSESAHSPTDGWVQFV